MFFDSILCYNENIEHDGKFLKDLTFQYMYDHGFNNYNSQILINKIIYVTPWTPRIDGQETPQNGKNYWGMTHSF